MAWPYALSYFSAQALSKQFSASSHSALSFENYNLFPAIVSMSSLSAKRIAKN